MTTMARPDLGELLAEVRDVVVDVPTFLTAPIARIHNRSLGATPAEISATMPGDDLVPDAGYEATRAITIDAPADAVWPWLVQIGCGRAGFYSNDLLDNLARPSARAIVADLQHLEIGQWVPMSPSSTPTDRTAFKVVAFDRGRSLLWRKPDSTWAWQLTPTNEGTRLVTRLRAQYEWRHPASALLTIVLMEFGDFAMMRRMLRGIKARAESVDHGDAS